MSEVPNEMKKLTDAEFDDLIKRANDAMAQIDGNTAEGGAYAALLRDREIREGKAQSGEFNRGVQTETAKSVGRAAASTRAYDATRSAENAKKTMDISAKSAKASVGVSKGSVLKSKAQTDAAIAETEFGNAEHDAYEEVTRDLRERKFALAKRKAAERKIVNDGDETETDGTTPENGSYNDRREQIKLPESLADRDPLGLREQNGQFVTDKNGNKTWKQDETGLKHTANTKTSVSRIDDFADTVFRNMAHTVDANGNYVYDLDYINRNVSGNSIQHKCMNAYRTVRNTYGSILENGLSAAKRNDCIEALKNAGMSEAYATGLVDDLGKYYAATLKKNMTAQAQLAKALGLEQSLDVRGYTAAALDVGAYDTELALEMIGQNDGDTLVSVGVYGAVNSRKLGERVPAGKNVGGYTAIEYNEIEMKTVDIATAPSEQIYALASRAANANEKQFLLGVLTDRVLNKGETDKWGVLDDHAAALKENEEKKAAAKQAEEEYRKARADLNSYAVQNYGEDASLFVSFVEDQDAAEEYIKGIGGLVGRFGDFLTNDNDLYKKAWTGRTSESLAGDFDLAEYANFKGNFVGDFTEDTYKAKKLKIALEAIEYADPVKAFELYKSLEDGAKEALDTYLALLSELSYKMYGVSPEYKEYRNEEEDAAAENIYNGYVHYKNLVSTISRKKDSMWISVRLSMLARPELAQGLIDIYTDGIDPENITDEYAAKFDVGILRETITNNISAEWNGVPVTEEDLDEICKGAESDTEKVKAMLEYVYNVAPNQSSEKFAQEYAKAYINKFFPGAKTEDAEDVAYAIELVGDQIKAQRIQQSVRDFMNTDSHSLNGLLDLGGLALSIAGNFLTPVPAFIEINLSGGGGRPKNFYGDFGRANLASATMRDEALGDISRNIFGAAAGALFGEDVGKGVEEWSNVILHGAMSVVDSYVAGLIFGGIGGALSSSFGVSAQVATAFAQNMTLLTMSSGAGYQTMVTMHEKGYSDSEAIGYGWAAFIAEFVTEKINIENVVNVKSLKGARAKFINALEEAGEEVASDLITDFYDAVIMNNSGEIAKEIEAYVAQGEDRGSAVGSVIFDHIVGYLQDAVGGFAGGGFGAAFGAISQHRENVAAQTQLGGAVRARPDLISEAKKTSEKANRRITAAETALTEKTAAARAKAESNGASESYVENRTERASNRLSREIGKAVQSNAKYESAKKTVSSFVESNPTPTAKDITKNKDVRKAVKTLSAKNAADSVSESGIKGTAKKIAKKAVGSVVTKKNAVEKLNVAKAVKVSDVAARSAKAMQNAMYDGDNAGAVSYAKDLAKTFPNSALSKKATDTDADYYTKEDADALREEIGRVGEAYARIRAFDPQNGSITDEVLSDLSVLTGQTVAAKDAPAAIESVKEAGESSGELKALADDIDKIKEIQKQLDEEDRKLIKRYKSDVQELLVGEEGELDYTDEDGKHAVSMKERVEAYEAFKSAAKAEIADDADLGMYEGKISEKLKARAIAEGAAEAGRSGKSGLSLAILDREEFGKMMASSKFASQVKLITALARRWGIHITLTDMLGYKNVYAKEANGLFTGGNHIVLDVNADYGLLTAAFTHEAYHYLEEKNKAVAEEMRKLVFDMLGEEGAKKARKEMRDRGYEEEYIDSEIVADSLFDALSEKGLMKKISSETRMTVSEMLAYLADSLEYMLNRLTGSESWRKQLRTQRLNYKVLSQMFERGMDGAENDAKRASLVEDIRGEKRPTVITKKNAGKRQSKKIEDGRTLAESLIEEYKKPITFDDVLTLRSIGRKSVNAFTSEDLQKAGKWAYKFYRELGTKSPFFRAWFGDWRQHDKSPAPFFANIKSLNITDTKSAASYFKSKLKSGELFRGDVVNKDTNFKINIGTFVYNDTLTYANRALSRSKDIDLYRARLSIVDNVRDIVENSVYLETSVTNGKKNNAGTYQSFYHYFYSLAQVDGKAYLVRLAVDELNSSTTVRRAYNVENIEISPVAVSQVYKPAGTTSDNGEKLSTISISDLFDIVKQFDDEFTSAPEVNPLLLNKDGTPKVFYHGTADVITEFQEKYRGKNTGAASAKQAYFFTDHKGVASGYAEDARPAWIEDLRRRAERLDNTAPYTGRYEEAEAAYAEYEAAELSYNSQGIVMPVYLRLENPLVYDFKGAEYREITYNDLIKQAKKNKNDGVIFLNTYDASNKKTDFVNTVVAVFDPKRIKSKTDNIGTFDGKYKDIRLSKKKEAAKSLKAEDVFGKDYGTEYAEAKAEIERLRRQVALAEEAVASFPVTKEDTKQDAESDAEQKDDPKKEAENQLARLRRVLRAKEGIVRRTDKLRSIVAQMKIKNENPARYAGLFRQALVAVRKAGNFRPSPVNAEMRKTITEIEDAYEPTLDDLTTKRGLEGLKKNHRQIYDAFRDFIREKTYIRPFDTNTYTEAVKSVAKGYNVTDADIMWLAEELKNATEVYINKPSDIQPSYAELVKEFDTILSDITERAAKPADGNEWAQDVKGKTVKLTADEYALVINTFGSLAEANRYMNGAVKFSRVKGQTLTDVLNGEKPAKVAELAPEEGKKDAKTGEGETSKNGWTVTPSAYGGNGQVFAYGGKENINAYSENETGNKSEADGEIEKGYEGDIIGFAKKIHDLFTRPNPKGKSIGRQVFEYMLNRNSSKDYVAEYLAEMEKLDKLEKISVENAAAYWMSQKNISYNLGSLQYYSRAFESDMKRRERSNLSEYRTRLADLLGQISKKVAKKGVTGAVKEKMAELVRMFEVEEQTGYTKLHRVITEMRTTVLDSEVGAIDEDSAKLYGEKLRQLEKKIGTRTLNSLNASEMREVYQIVRAMYKTLNDADKILLDGRAQELKAVRDEIRREINTLARKRIGKFSVMTTANPMRFAEVLSNFDRESTVYKTFADLEHAEYEATTRMCEYLKPFDELTGASKSMDKALSKKNNKLYLRFVNEYIETPFTDAKTSEKVRMSRSELIQLYMTWLRETHSDKLRHLQLMGFELGNRKALEKGKSKDAFVQERLCSVGPVTVMQMSEVYKILFEGGSELDGYCKKWLETSQEFFRRAGQDIDRVYYERYFVHLDREEFYVPVSVDMFEVQGDIPDSASNGTVVKYEQSGKLKPITPKAPQHVKIGGLHGVISKEAKSTANIVELMLPLKQFRTVWGSKLEAADGRVSSVQKELAEKFKGRNGEDVVKYIIQLQNDLAGASRRTELFDPVNKIFGWANSNFTSAALNTLSVIIKQISALPYALHTVSFRNLFFKMGPTGLWYKGKVAVNRRALLAEYEAHGIYEFTDRLRGTFSVDMTRANEKPHGVLAWLKKGGKGPLARARQKFFTAWFNGITAFDANTCLVIGEAIKEDSVAAGFKRGSDEYWADVKERVRKAITYTQQVNDVMHGTNLQKTANEFTRTISMFTSQATMVKSMFQFSYMEMLANRKTPKARESVKKFAKTLLGFAAGQISFEVLRILVDGINHRWDRYEDEEGKISIEKMCESVLFGAVANTVETFLVFSPLVELADAIVENYFPYEPVQEAFKSYGVSDPRYDMVNDLCGLIKDAVGTVGKVVDGDFDFSENEYTVKKFISLMGSLTGLPAESWYTLGKSIFAYAKDISSGIAWENIKQMVAYGSYYDPDFTEASSGYKAYVGLVIEGRTDAAEIFKTSLEEYEKRNGAEESEIGEKFDKGVAKALMFDERIADAYRAYVAGDSVKYAQILDGITEFSSEIVNAAAKNYIDKVTSSIKTINESDSGADISSAKKYLEKELHMTKEEIGKYIGEYRKTVTKNDLFSQIYKAWKAGQDYTDLENTARQTYSASEYTSGFAAQLAKDERIKTAYDAKVAGNLTLYEKTLSEIDTTDNIKLTAIEKFANAVDKNIGTIYLNLDPADVREARAVLIRDYHLTAEEIDKLVGEYIPKQTGGGEKEMKLYKPADAVQCAVSGNTTNAKHIIAWLRKDYVAAGKTEDEANSKVRSALTTEFKSAYRYAYATGNEKEKKRISGLLLSLDVGYTADGIRGWCLKKDGTNTADYNTWLENGFEDYKAALG